MVADDIHNVRLCILVFPGSLFTVPLSRAVAIAAVCSGVASSSASTWQHTVAPSERAPAISSVSDLRASHGLYAQVRETCFLKGERTDGMNKICFYDCPSGDAAITVSAVSLCPL